MDNNNNNNDTKNEEQIEEKVEELHEKQEEINKESKESELEKKAKEWEDKYKRALADYNNLQRNTNAQRINWISQANKDLILKFLPVLDTLLLVAKHFPDKSLDLAIKQYQKVLEEEGLQKIKTEEEDFNPSLMECVTTKEGQEGKVLEELRPGYKLNESILRTAQVIVGKKL